MHRLPFGRAIFLFGEFLYGKAVTTVVGAVVARRMMRGINFSGLFFKTIFPRCEGIATAG